MQEAHPAASRGSIRPAPDHREVARSAAGSEFEAMTQKPIIRGRYERFATGILALALGFLLMPISIYLWTIAELVIGVFRWSFGPAVPL